MLKSKSTLWLLVAVALYSVGQLTWYLPTPLGESPALDGQENLLLAEQISDGTLLEEPFYRAMLYPFILAYWPASWAILGLIAHLANTYLAYKLSLRIWKHAGGALLSGALVGFNPVLLHYAFDPLDITLATSFFLIALNFIPEALSPSRFADRWLSSSLCGLFLGIACLARPHFFAVLIPVVVFSICAWFRKRVEWQRSILFTFFAALPILIYGFVQVSVGGQFKILPWQGAYNLWASNNGNANGVYFTQSLEFHYLDEHQNPTRLEDETLYRQENGFDGTIDQRSSYWRGKTFERILSEPLDWVRLMAFKAYALVNNYEQYNNKTFSFHRNLSPWLRYNPICWGMLLILAAASISTLWRQSKRELMPFLIIAVAFSLGVLIYMASGRFRLPLVPLLAVFAGGTPFAFKAYKVSSAKIRRKTHISVAASAALSLSFFFGVNAKDTYVQDTLLLADSAAKLGRDVEAISWAETALEIDPSRQAAQRIKLIARYNQIVSGSIPTNAVLWKELGREAAQIAFDDEALAFVRGVILWNSGENDLALRTWNKAYQDYNMRASSSLAAIMIAAPDAVNLDVEAGLVAELKSGAHPLLSYAIAAKMGEGERNAFLESIELSPESYQALGESLGRVF